MHESQPRSSFPPEELRNLAVVDRDHLNPSDLTTYYRKLRR